MDVVTRAQRAKAILEDTLFKEAFDMLLHEQISVFTSQSCDADKIMEAHRMVRALRGVEQKLKDMMVSGKMFEKRNDRKGQHRG